MEYALIIGALVAIAVVIFLVSKHKKDTSASTTTPKGVLVIGHPGTVTLAAIDRQLDDLFRIAEGQGYSGFTRHEGYTVEILPSDPRCQQAAFSVAAPEYDGTEYDTDPRPGYSVICAAGRFLPESRRIQATEAGILTTNIVRYEGEHRLLFEVDKDRYERTKFHTPENRHPLLGD